MGLYQQAKIITQINQFVNIVHLASVHWGGTFQASTSAGGVPCVGARVQAVTLACHICLIIAVFL